MKNMKVAIKLIVGFGIMLALSAIIGIVSTVGMSSLDDAASELYEANLMAVGAMGDLRELFIKERYDLRSLLLNYDNPEQVKTLLANFEEYERIAAESFACYDLTIRDESAESDYFAAKKAWYGAFAQTKQDFFNCIAANDVEGAANVFAAGSSAIAPIETGFSASALLNDQWASDTNAATSSLYTTLKIVMILIILAAVAVAVLLTLYISNLISKPVVLMSQFLNRFATNGNIEMMEEDKAIYAKKGNDEIGDCQRFMYMVIERLNDINAALGKVADGDLTVNMKILSDKDSMGISLNKMLDNLNSMFTHIRTVSDQVSSGAGQVAQGAQGLASGSSQQAASIEELSSSLSQLQDKTTHNAQDSSSAREANNKTSKALDESIHSMGQMLDAMKEIDESSTNITKVIKVIDDIAFQTNILALNAAVEAARAGQHGKGFAVVAEEVRNLAAKSAEAAKETSSLIEGSTVRVREGNEIVAKTNENLETAVTSAAESTRLIEQVAIASIEQAKSITEINIGMDQISTVVQANSATAEQSAAASEEMSAQAVAMNEIVAKFKLVDSVNK